MIQLFKVSNHKIDTSKFSNLLHDNVVEEFEKTIADYVGAKYACSVNSATSALHLACLALGLGPNDYLWTTLIE